MAHLTTQWSVASLIPHQLTTLLAQIDHRTIPTMILTKHKVCTALVASPRNEL